MKKVTIVFLIALLLLVVVDVALSVFSTGLSNKPSANHPSYSVEESKARGAFIEPVKVTPSAVAWKGKPIRIKEAWLEHQTELEQIYVIIPFVYEHHRYRQVDGYNLCFNFTEAGGLFSDPQPFFVVEGKGSGFSMRGSVIAWERLASLAQVPEKVLLTDKWEHRDSQVLVITRTAR